jgi:ribosome maturation factor RimP
LSKVTDRVTELVTAPAQRLGLEIWDVEFQREGPRWVLRVVIDHPDGVSIDQCEALSRAIDPLLDEADPIPQSYVLEVTSAGLERALKRDSDFRRFLGHAVEVGLYKPHDGRREYLGELISHDGQWLTIREDGTERKFPMGDVAGVRLRLL